MKKILFCTLNSKYIHSSLAPWYLCSAVEQFCSCPVEADVIEATVNESVDVITSRIIEAHPDFLGFSVYIWNRTKTFDIIKTIKEYLPDIKVAVGGPEVAYDV